MFTFSGRDQLNHFFGAAEPFLDAYAGMDAIAKMDGEAVGKWPGLRPRFHEALHQIGELIALDARKEPDAGHTCGVEEIGETAFGGAGFQGDAIEQELRAGGPQEQATLTGGSHCIPKLTPGGVELPG